MGNERYIRNLIETPIDNKSVMEKLSLLPKEERESIVDKIVQERFQGDYGKLKYCWDLWRRPSQWYPEHNDWKIFCMLMGRGSGKTKSAAEIIRYRAETGLSKNICLIGPTANDVISTMLNGNSGLMNICPPWDRPILSPTYKTITWANGARAVYRSADEPERIRGINADLVWFDEIAAASYAKEAFDMAMFGLRIGNPKAIITTTPKPFKYLLDIIGRKDCYTITGSSYENSANIDLSMFLEEYEGTRLGRQELNAELLFDNPDSLWSFELIEKARLNKADKIPELIQIVVGVDPAVSVSNTSAETGISVVGYGMDGHLYVLYADGFKMQPIDWAKKVLEVYDYYRADKIVVEVNQGGDLVKSNLQQLRPLLPIYPVHATKAKTMRAEPIATLYSMGKVHHVGYFPKLEEQMLNFPPPDTKTVIDCLEACVWACTAIMELTASGGNYVPSVGGYRNKLKDYMTKISHIG